MARRGKSGEALRAEYRREYQARVARNLARGLSRAQATGHGRRANAPTIRQLEASGAIPKAPARTTRLHRPKVTRLDQLGPGTARFHTTDAKVIRQAVREAEAQGLRVTFQLIVDTPAGPRTRTLDGRGDQAAMVADAASTGEPTGPSDEGERTGDIRDRLVGKVDVTVGNATVTRGGFDPAAVLAAWDAYDGDLWAWFDDLADSEY